MTDSWNDLDGSERAFAETVFTALSIADSLTAEAEREAPRRLAAADIHRLVQDPDGALDDATRLALASNPRLTELFNGLIRQAPVGVFPRAAAAADGPTLDRRLANGFRIRLVPSRSTEGQTYVIIDLPLGLARPAEALFIVRPHAVPWKFRLPPPMHGQIQLLAETQSDLVIGLADPETEVFLR